VYGYYDDSGNAVPGWKAAGVKVDVFAATEQALNVTAVISVSAGYTKADVITLVEDSIYAYLQGLDIGATAIKSEIIAIAMSIDGVTNFVMSAPTSDTAVANNIKIMPGTFAIT
jgi:uncharacterized phage protein gp47/JayE